MDIPLSGFKYLRFYFFSFLLLGFSLFISLLCTTLHFPFSDSRIEGMLQIMQFLQREMLVYYTNKLSLGLSYIHSGSEEFIWKLRQ